MKNRIGLGLVVTCAAFAAQAIETAGNLLVNLNPASLSVSDGATVSSWPNTGTLGGSFVPVVSGQGAVYQSSVAGVAAVTFAASANSVMTNTVLPPSSILGGGVWSAEIWVRNPTLEAPEDQLSWTDRGNFSADPSGTCMEIRYGNDIYNGVEHYSGTYNMQWNGGAYGIPPAGVWHYIAITRASDGTEKLFADGKLCTTKVLATLNLRNDSAPFALGGVRDRDASGWAMLFSGSLARARVHDGTLSDAQVLSNYLAEREAFQSIWSGTTGSWTDSANWVSNRVATSGGAAWIDNGGTPTLSSDLSLNFIYPYVGGLTINSGAKLTSTAASSVNMGNGGAFTLTLSSGALNLPDSGGNILNLGANGGSGTATLGGSGDSAVIDVDQDIVVGKGSGSTGQLTVQNGGAAYCSNGWFYVADGVGSVGQVDVNAGVIGFRSAAKNFVVSINGGHGVVNVNGGQINSTGDFEWSAGTSSGSAYGAVYLNSGSVQAKRFFAVDTAGTDLLYLNGGTVKALETHTDFLYNLSAAYVQAGGAKFDVPSNVTVTAAQPLLADTGSAGGGLTKSGLGHLILSGTNTFAGNIDLQAGGLWFRNSGGLLSGYAGTITMTNTGASIGYEKAGGVAELLSHMSTSSKGQIMLFSANAGDTINFSSYPGLTLGMTGSFTYTGTYTPYASHYVFAPQDAGNVYSAAITGASSVEVNGTTNGVLELTGDSSYTGGTALSGGTLIMSHVNALGDASGTIAISNGATLKLNVAGLPASFGQRITPDSQGQILLGAACTNLALNLDGRPGIIVGTDQATLNYSSTITPANNTYRLGGGGVVWRVSPNQGLVLTNLSDGGSANKVVVEKEGIVRLATGNTYSGGTVITNNGAIFLMEDGGLGAAPASPDPANIYVDNGGIRSAFANFSVSANRGLTVGSGGMELHPWSTYTMTVLGNLNGTGRIFTSDGGSIIFGGVNNAWNGTMDIRSGATIGVGTGSTFSWNPSAVIAGNGGTLALNNNSDFTWSTAMGSALGANGASVGLRKQGTGTLTVDVTPSYAYDTSIEGGTLKAGTLGAVPSGAGKGNVSVSSGAQLDVNGMNVSVNGLSGAGKVIDSIGSASVLTAGLNNASATFTGSVAPALKLVKSGTGTETLGTGAAVKNVQIQQGALAMVNPVAPTGSVDLVGSGIVRVSGYGPTVTSDIGLTGFYYDLAPTTDLFSSLTALNALLDPRTPSLIANSGAVGSTFNFGSDGGLFPSPYNAASREQFAIRWLGKFVAETAGTYTFATASDDGSLVFIDGAMVVNNNYMQGYDYNNRRSGSVSLTAGQHDIVIVFYENGGNQGLTVYLTTPGGSEQVLPQSLLKPLVSQFTSLSGESGTRLELVTNGVVNVNQTVDTTFGGVIYGTNAASQLIKSGTGKLTLTSGSSSFVGSTYVNAGTLGLANAGTLGALNVGSGAAVTVTNASSSGLSFPYTTTSGNGLPGAYYDFVPGSYTMYNSQATLEAYLASYTPDLVAGSDLAGATFNFNSSGSLFPGIYGNTPVFQAFWKGIIDIPTDGAYTFYTASDDGSMLFIDGAVVVANNYLQGVTERSGTVTLTAGTHAIAIAFYDNGGGWGLYANIAGPGISKQLIPNSMLHPAASSIGPLAGAGALTLQGAGAAIKINEQTSSTYAGGATGPVGTGISKAGSQTLTLTGNNDSFLGTWYLLAGTLQIGNGGTAGTLGGSGVVTSVGSSLVFDRSDNVVYTGAVSGGGTLQSIGAGTVTLSGNLSGYTGTVQIAAGQTINMARTIANSVVVTNNGTFALSSGTYANNAASIGGSGTTVVTGGTFFYLANPGSFLNAVALDGGILSIPLTSGVLSNLSVKASSTSGLALGVTTNGQAWTINRLAMETNSLLQVTPCGLFGKYVDAYDSAAVQTAFSTLDAAVAYINSHAVTLSASSCEAGETFDFGRSDVGAGTRLSGKYAGAAAVNFVTQWKGKIRIDVEGTYTFATTSDDNSVLFIDGAQIVNNNYNQGMTTRSGTVSLTKGLHDIAIFLGQGTGGYGLYVDITFPNETVSRRLPNAMLVPDDADLPSYSVTANTLVVTNAPGNAAIAFNGPGTLRISNLWFQNGSVLTVTGKVAVAGSELKVTVPQQIPYGATLVGDFTATDGLDLTGVTLTAAGTEGSLKYRDKRLYLVRNNGTLLIMR